MPDISMCNNKDCPSFEKCYRAQAVPAERRQSVQYFKPEDGADRCEYFWRLEEGDHLMFQPGNNNQRDCQGCAEWRAAWRVEIFKGQQAQNRLRSRMIEIIEQDKEPPNDANP